jgi:tripartite-type tricarboxylate transporter receptor subunit TctC
MQRKFRTGTFFAIGLMFIYGAPPFLSLDCLRAQDFPTKPITLVIPFGAGGASDLQARTFINTATIHMGQPIVIQIRAGGAGAIGSEMVAQAKPDGHTLLFGFTGCNSVLPAIEGRSKGPDDLAAVCTVTISGSAYWVKSNSPFKNIKDVIDYAKANPGKLSFGNTGARSVTDVAWRWLEFKTGMKTKNVGFTGGAEALVALLGDHIQVSRLNLDQCMPHMRAGTIRPIAATDFERHPDLPDVPTMKEQGYDIGVGGSWRGILAPKATPQPIIDKLVAGFKKMMGEKQAIAALAQQGNRFEILGPVEFDKHWREEVRIYKELGRELLK